MKPEEIKEELKPSTREIISAGPARPPQVNLDYVPLPNIRKIIKDS
jgi:hypothetical protein